MGKVDRKQLHIQCTTSVRDVVRDGIVVDIMTKSLTVLHSQSSYLFL